MAKAYSYGIISDIHLNPLYAKRAVRALLEQESGLDFLIVNGDFSGNFGEDLTIKKSDGSSLNITAEDFAWYVLSVCAKFGKESKNKFKTYISFGNHELMGNVEGVVDELCRQHPDYLVKTTADPDNRIVTPADGNHRVVVLPGADVGPGQYRLMAGNELPETGYHHLPTPQGKQHMYVSRIEDLVLLAEGVDPKSLVVVTHCPPKCAGEQAIDFTKYAKVKHEGQESIVPLAQVEALRNQGLDVVEEEGNVGNEMLAGVMKQLGLEHVVCGHLHGGPKLHAADGSAVASGDWTKSMYFNTGSVDSSPTMKEDRRGYAGLVLVNENNVRPYIVPFHVPDFGA